ncbi:hypothetical protein [Jiella sonneratiae]|uniref:Uncharacterized protein n=1 Tax=Jiella sonneratiae TaxID=2816856 RepID=A0ABS3IZ46_9HYPH|nr:hypothetical protein [Jiella sonneratiae]MBO0902185.1 hypothetical protein [Jiella sonneratiae]
MIVDPPIVGALLGLVVGVADLFVIGQVMARMKRERPSERLGAMTALNVARVAQLILFPVMGWFVGQAFAS